MAETGTQANNRIRKGLGLQSVVVEPTVAAAPPRQALWMGISTGVQAAPATVKETPSQVNARILGNLGLDTALTPKKKKKPETVLSAQTEIVNTLGE